MKFLVITHVDHVKEGQNYLAYEPYVREMNIWFKYVNQVEIVAPIAIRPKTDIDIPYNHDNLSFSRIPAIEFTSLKKIFKSVFKLPLICFQLMKACKRADHIHLRCPGNIGMLGCFVQVFFPGKTKTAKYAGNWDPRANQPLSYKIQRKILANTLLTKSIKVLIYGKWSNQTKNIVPFFTASYKVEEKEQIAKRDYNDILSFVFVGSLVKGKRPLLAIQIVESLHQEGKKVSLDIYGDGILKEELMHYVSENNLNSIMRFHGNQSKEVVKNTLRIAHFLVLASKSEGWPKVIAEAMFFGVIPITTNVSCISYMLDKETRGIIIEPALMDAVIKINKVLSSKDLNEMSRKGCQWAQQYTLDYFEMELEKLLIKT